LRLRYTCSRRTRQIDTARMSHRASAPPKVNAASCAGSARQTTVAKPTSAIAPIDAPRASSAADRRPRVVCAIPTRCFASSCAFSTGVALAGKMAGKARNSPPMTGPKWLAIRPVATVIAPPRIIRIKCWRQGISRKAASFRCIATRYLSSNDHNTNALIPHIGSADRAAAGARMDFPTMRYRHASTYSSSATAPATIERASSAA